MLLLLAGLVITATTAGAVQAGSADEVSCALVMPGDPLTAAGLATPYRLQTPCHQGDSGTAAFVEGMIFDPATNKLSVYSPLVIDEGTHAAVAPTAPQLPAGAVVGLWFGFNGDNLTLQSADSKAPPASCVNGYRGSIFGQFAFCNAAPFFQATNAAIRAGKLKVPSPGTAADGKACPSTRDFALVDMDQSDNVTTTYLVLPDGSTAQNTAANRAALGARGARVQANGSDNALLTAFVFPALSCKPFTAPNLADPGARATALALNELQAAAHQLAPVALVPINDPMTLVDGGESAAKTNLYRTGVNQPAVDRAADTPTAYCHNLVTVGTTRTDADRNLTKKGPSPDPDAANSLFTFLARRLAGSFDELNCAKLLGTQNPVTIVTNDKDVAIDAQFATGTPPTPSGGPSTSHSPSAGPSASHSPSTGPSASHSPSASTGPSTAHSPSASHSPTSSAAGGNPGGPGTSTSTGNPTGNATGNPAGRQGQPAPPPPTRTTQPPPAGGTTPTPGGLMTAVQGPPPPPGATQPAPSVPVPSDPTTDGGADTDLTLPAGLEDLPVDRVPLKQPKTVAAKYPVAKLTVGALLVLGGVILLIRVVGSASRRRRRMHWAY